MTDKTTIEITTDQREELKKRKRHKREAYRDVIDRLLDGDGNERILGMFEETLEQAREELEGSEE